MAAMRSIVRRDTHEGYREYLERLATEAGIEEPTRNEMARLDRKRKGKASNDDWTNPNDPDARMAHPTPDHLIPLMYVLGASADDDAVRFSSETFDLGSISMRNVIFG